MTPWREEGCRIRIGRSIALIDLLRKNGTYYKANLHCHTVLSDGKMTPMQVKNLYQRQGYSIVGFTDHSKYAEYPELCDESFLAIPGVEAAFTCLDPNNSPLKYKLCHINFYPTDLKTAVYVEEEHTYDVGNINRYIEKMKKAGWICTLNHPGWSLQSTEEINGLIGLDGFEIYNHKSVIHDNNGDGQAYYAIFLNSGRKAWAVATDDCHTGLLPDGSPDPVTNDTCGGYIMMSMPSLSYENFVDAFIQGRFYASSGPELINYYIDEEKDMVVLDCSAVSNVLLKGIHTVKGASLLASGNTITHAEFPLGPIRKKEPFFRLEVCTKDLKRAYSQPYWFE